MTCQLCEKPLPKGVHEYTQYHKECKAIIVRCRVKLWRDKMKKKRRKEWSPLCERCNINKKFSRNLTVKYCVECRYSTWAENSKRHRQKLKASDPSQPHQTTQ